MSVIVMEGTHCAGKSTVIDELTNRYDLISRKSIPDWFRKYLEFARSLEPDPQKKVYMIGHEANYTSFMPNCDYILDRFFYTTIVRLNYDLNKSTNDTVDEILSIPLEPSVVIYLKAEKDLIAKRLQSRGNYQFNNNFFEYEYQIFKQLSEIYDKIIIVDNSGSLDDTIKRIDEELKVKQITLKGRN